MESTLSPGIRDTICAVSTPPGVGGIAVIRVSGPEAFRAVDKIRKGARLASSSSHTAHLGDIIDPEDNSILDQAVATLYKGPNSYTGDDTVEISIHGSQYIQKRLLRILIDHCGIRLAEPGEFTMRAFSSGKLSLTQAEAVADIIASDSKAAHRIATTQFSGKTHERLSQLRDNLTRLAALLELELDFSEEDVVFADRNVLTENAEEIKREISALLGSFTAGKAIKEGIPVAITGATNAGKSSLLNLIVDDDRAIVSDIHGTTRDTIEVPVSIGDYRFRFIDTAGLRETDDTIEKLGINRSKNAVASSFITLLVMDSTSVHAKEDILKARDSISKLMPSDNRLIIILNKSDKHALLPEIYEGIENTISLSALTGTGFDTLRKMLLDIAGTTASSDELMITNERHRIQLQEALDSIERVIAGLRSRISTDLIAFDLRTTIHHLSLLTGDITTDDLLSHVFSHFCIGK